MAATHPIMTPLSLGEQQQKRRQKIDKGLEAILEILDSGAATRVPLVQSAFVSAARIFDISLEVGAKQDEFVEFAEGGYRLVYSISLKLADDQEIEQNLRDNLKELLDTLQSIEILGEKCAAKGTIKAHDNNDSEVKAQRQKLEQCMRSFEFQSLHELREKTNQLVEQHGQNGSISNTSTNKYNITGNNTNYAFSNVNNVFGTHNNISSMFDRMMFRPNTNNDINFGDVQTNAISLTLDRIWRRKK